MKKTTRSHHCGELSAKNLGENVELCGWVATRRDHGGLVFVDLRDRWGITQVVFDPKAEGGQAAHQLAGELRSEFVLWCKGRVRRRPEGMVNSKLQTGEIEVICEDLVILSEAKTPPFEIPLHADEDEIDVNENVRLKYRYIDLRRPKMQKNLVTRHRALASARQFLNEREFIEVETPILYKSTPEGARDFIVPSRLNAGQFYALPQSPQTLKQLLMVSGFDRYYQIARCFRDEDLRADRQPEFSQIDIETSFLDEDGLFEIIEGMVQSVWKEVAGIEVQTPFPRMPFWEAMHRFGSDKPETRFGLELQDLTSVFAKSSFNVFQAALQTNALGEPGSIRCIHVKGKAESFSRKDLDDLTRTATSHGAKGLLWLKVQPDKLQSPAAKFFSEEETQGLKETLGLSVGDLVLIVSDGEDEKVCNALGAVRLELGNRLKLIPEGAPPYFLWITRFPLLQYDGQDKRYYARHHPFTQPHPSHLEDFLAGKNLHRVEASAYDLVSNGAEVAGGSLRIYQKRVQDRMFEVLGIGEEEARKKFGFFLDALQYGTPPHGGIAFGVERLACILAGVGPIRDVMAFPKTQKGHDLMAETPSSVSPEQLTEVGISLRKG